jgi:hypothetical protein
MKSNALTQMLKTNYYSFAWKNMQKIKLKLTQFLNNSFKYVAHDFSFFKHPSGDVLSSNKLPCIFI